MTQTLDNDEFDYDKIQGIWYEISLYPYTPRNRYIKIYLTGNSSFTLEEYEYINNIENVIGMTTEKAESSSPANNRLYEVESPIQSRVIDIKFVDSNYLYIFQPLNLAYKIPYFNIYYREPTITKNIYCDLRESMKCFGVEPFRLIVSPDKIIKEQNDNIIIEAYEI